MCVCVCVLVYHTHTTSDHTLPTPVLAIIVGQQPPWLFFNRAPQVSALPAGETRHTRGNQNSHHREPADSIMVIFPAGRACVRARAHHTHTHTDDMQGSLDLTGYDDVSPQKRAGWLGLGRLAGWCGGFWRRGGVGGGWICLFFPFLFPPIML